MKQKTLYYLPSIGEFMFINSIKEDRIIFSISAFYSDLFTTIQHFSCSAKWLQGRLVPIELNADNINQYITFRDFSIIAAKGLDTFNITGTAGRMAFNNFKKSNLVISSLDEAFGVDLKEEIFNSLNIIENETI